MNRARCLTAGRAAGAPAPTPPPRAGLVGEILCAPGQHAHRFHLHLVDTQAELRRDILLWSGQPVSDDVQACCCLEPATSAPYLGFLIFSREHLCLPHLVHEVTHAGAAFIMEHVAESDAVRAMSAEDAGDYLDEALATTVETLFSQALKHLRPRWPSPGF